VEGSLCQGGTTGVGGRFRNRLEKRGKGKGWGKVGKLKPPDDEHKRKDFRVKKKNGK